MPNRQNVKSDKKRTTNAHERGRDYLAPDEIKSLIAGSIAASKVLRFTGGVEQDYQLNQ